MPARKEHLYVLRDLGVGKDSGQKLMDLCMSKKSERS
jgi:hypothetical protein